MGVKDGWCYCDECEGRGVVAQTVCALEGTFVELPCIPCNGVGFWREQSISLHVVDDVVDCDDFVDTADPVDAKEDSA